MSGDSEEFSDRKRIEVSLPKVVGALKNPWWMEACGRFPSSSPTTMILLAWVLPAMVFNKLLSVHKSGDDFLMWPN